MGIEKICSKLLNKFNRVLGIIKITKHYGIENQLVKAVEEYSELIKAVTKYIQKPTIANKMQITEEIADCEIMSSQLVYLLELNADVIENMMDEKVERQIKRIEGKHEEE